MITFSVRGRIALVALLAAASLAAAATKSSDVVKASVKADKPDAAGKQTVTITLDIAKHYRLYANPVGNDLLMSMQTTVKFPGKVDVVKIGYPAGTVLKDTGVGDFKIYDGKVAIKAIVRRAEGDPSPLQVSVKIQAKQSHRCLMPSTLKLTAE